MAGIGGLFKGVKAAFAKTAQGAPKGTYTKLGKDGAELATKAKPGYKMVGGKVSKESGALAALKRNPKATLGVGAATLGAGYLLTSGSSTPTQPTTQPASLIK